ncbi:MAG: ATPase with chaperone activity [Burkholderiaceae bacterium]
MSDQNQLTVPESFALLYQASGGYKSTLPRDELYERFEFCDDLANMLTEHAANIRFDTGIDEQDVLERVQAGLLAEDSVVSAVEAPWVVGRLAELMNWQPMPVVPENSVISDDSNGGLANDEDSAR